MPTAPHDWQATTRDGARLAGDQQGPPDGPPIVLLHGLSSNLRWWDPVAAQLARRHRVVRYDHRGHGRSASPANGYTVGQLAGDTLDVLDRLGLDRVVLAGHSAGAAVALALAATCPDRVAALACVEGGVYDPRLCFGADWDQARGRMLHDRRGHPTAPVLREWLRAQELPPETLPCLLANYQAAGDGGLRLRLHPCHEEQLAHSLWSQDLARLLGAVRAPVLVVAALGDDEAHNRPRLASLGQAREILGDRLDVWSLPGGHDLPLQQPVGVADALADLAASATPARSLV